VSALFGAVVLVKVRMGIVLLGLGYEVCFDGIDLWYSSPGSWSVCLQNKEHHFGLFSFFKI